MQLMKQDRHTGLTYKMLDHVAYKKDITGK